MRMKGEGERWDSEKSDSSETLRRCPRKEIVLIRLFSPLTMRLTPFGEVWFGAVVVVVVATVDGRRGEEGGER